MKIQLPAHAQFLENKVILKATTPQDIELIKKFFAVKAQRENNNNTQFCVQVLLDLPYQRKTLRQTHVVWKLVTVIFVSMENRKPTEEEKYNLYLDLLDVYAQKIPSKVTGKLRAIHLSESNSIEAAHFIDSLLYHAATECDLEYDAQTTVRDVLFQWEAWKGGLNNDHGDYTDENCETMITEAQWREKHVYSQVSGRGGIIERAHIVSKGSSEVSAEASWNWIAMTTDEHRDQHSLGWDTFLSKYPHLRARVLRAREKAKKL